VINFSPLTRFVPLAGGLLKPLYADYAFANLPATIERLLTGEAPGPLLPPDCFGGSYPQPRKVVLFFIDSFAWSFWREHSHRYRTTRRVTQKGVLTPISALFPTTTAASVTTLYYGAPPAVHALYEWNVYIPDYGEVIQTLPFCPLGRRVPDACLAKGYDPRKLVVADETIHQRLARRGVRSIQFAHRSYADSAYNGIAHAGAEIIRHQSLAEALVQLKDALTQTTDRAWFNLYWAGIDSIGHIHGPKSRHHGAEVASFWRTFDEVFRDVNSPDTIYLFTADHGQVSGDPRQTVYLNERAPELADCLAVSPTGHCIYPNGSPRDVFLHLKPERLDEALATLRSRFSDDALILPMDEALEHGLFGPGPVGGELRRRLGDVLLLPYPGRLVW
jgi:predicted AlkP superfamily pyrophosphatase or phosphodiesterase